MRFDELPQSWQYKIRELRTDAAKYRVERNELRAELAALKAQLSK
jgi:hypothetical protein